MGRIKEHSILQQEHCCWLCGNTNTGILERHEVFFGNPNRQRSIEDGLTVLLCGDSCHRNGQYAVHQNADTNLSLKKFAQQEAMHYFVWTIQEFVQRYGKNYLDKEWSK